MLRVAGLLVLAAVAVPPAARADTPLVADPTTVNVSRFGETVAWSRRADDGTHRLVVRTADGTLDAAIAPSVAGPFDPDVGPDALGEPVVVYARDDGDLYVHRPGTGGDRRLAAASSADTVEAAPSIHGGLVAFARLDGAKPGLYLGRPGRRARRLNASVPAETDLSATRVLSRHGTRAVRLSTLSGDAQRTVARADAGTAQRLMSPSLGASGPTWLRVFPGDDVVAVERLRAGDVIEYASRELPGTTSSLSVSGGPPLFTDAAGVQRVAPALRFSPAQAP